MKVGWAFSESIEVSKNRKGKRNFEFKGAETRDIFLLVIGFLVVGLLLVKLFMLQIVEGSRYRDLSNSNRIKTLVVHAPRGTISDRNGEPLVFNIPGYRKLDHRGKVKLLSKDEAVPLISKGENLEYDNFREYPYRDTFAHVLGYIGEVSEEDLKNPKLSDYKSGDYLGKMGLEEQYEKILRGLDGRHLIEVDSNGKQVRKLGETDPIPGRDLKTTLDLSLQKAAYEAMEKIEKGAVVATTPKGEILTLLSKPSFDPNLFTLPEALLKEGDGGYPNLFSVLSDTKKQPLLNRAIGGTYPPGSTFKLVVAATGLEKDIIDEDYIVEDNGTISIGAFSFSNWYFTQYGKTEGPVDVVKGIKRSNDIFFYKLAEKVGVEQISSAALSFGLGKTLGIDIKGEEKGIIPTPSWKKEAIGEQWYLGDTYHYGIGQGYLLTTPLQVNAWTSVFATGGELYKPQLVYGQTPQLLGKNILSEKSVKLVRQGMIESCAPGGVAWPFFEFKVKGKSIQVACKTGTAQQGGEKDLPHAWITLFAPAYDPEIIVTVLAEASGEGSNVAAPVAKKILEEWFNR
jgi:penicillin-binding protein 2